MAKILSIVTLPGTYPVPIERMTTIYEEMHADKEMVKKMNALIRAGPVWQKHCFLPDFSLHVKDRLVYHSFKTLPSTAERMKVYKQLALGIAGKASRQAIEKAKSKSAQITHLISFSCTGLYAPGLEFELSETLELSPYLKKFTVNFMGCHAAFHALRLAHMIIESSNRAKVLIVGLEICSLHLNNNKSDDNLLANYLFSDGCAACVLGASHPGPVMETVDFQSATFPQSKDMMAWEIGNLGFEMKLHRKLPAILKENLNELLNSTLQQFDMDLSEINEFAIHPGGKNVLEAFEKALDIPSEKLQNSHETLARFGNMSSVTILFVLERILNGPVKKETESQAIYAAAFGPGVSLESALIMYQ
ncbi:type III polyketide synthase [Cyclobacterium sp.]|uniref:type III polyketide synthase n=1 Tax=Cyclobacterium sp. TaxID=1966343 RepID=UPI001994308E|nr:type III polyketide synthase [Cyclobacterium sp.]MBD3630633.1 type III polyketide synthase [Cyclobacterium sp.]